MAVRCYWPPPLPDRTWLWVKTNGIRFWGFSVNSSPILEPNLALGWGPIHSDLEVEKLASTGLLQGLELLELLGRLLLLPGGSGRFVAWLGHPPPICLSLREGSSVGLGFL